METNKVWKIIMWAEM